VLAACAARRVVRNIRSGRSRERCQSRRGYETVRGATNLNPGDTVMVQAGGSAQIVYPDGCVVPVEVGAVVAVGEASPCVNLGWLELPEIPKEFLIAVGVMAAIAGAAAGF
jgi:hypothetical protein